MKKEVRWQLFGSNELSGEHWIDSLPDGDAIRRMKEYAKSKKYIYYTEFDEIANDFFWWRFER